MVSNEHGFKLTQTTLRPHNTVSVYEPPVKNSGIVGGKFLERTLEPVRKPDSRAPYTAGDGARFE